MNKQQFMRDLCKTFGTGGLICSFNDKKLAEFHQFLEQDFPFSEAKSRRESSMLVDKNMDFGSLIQKSTSTLVVSWYL